MITLNEYAKKQEAISVKEGRVCLTRARTSQGSTALIAAAAEGHTACVQALVATKAALDIKNVRDTRLFACPATLESPSSSNNTSTC
jgi:hypothetical protein